MRSSKWLPHKENASGASKEAKQQSNKSGGYDSKFVRPPPEAFQTECPICLQILRDPHQTKCCAKCFCSSCLKEHQQSQERFHKNQCPTCGKDNLSTFEDRRLRLSLEQLHIYCSHQHRGCEWTGELGELDRHLNKNPAEGKEQEGCPYVEVQCVHCERVFERRLLYRHPFDKCPKRSVQCPNKEKGCDWHGELRNLNQHIKRDCPMVEVECEFKDVGCIEPLLRKDVDTHRTSNVNKHMLLLLQKNKAQEEESRRLVARNASNVEEIQKLTNHLHQAQQEKATLGRDFQTANNKIQMLERSIQQEASTHRITIVIVATAFIAILAVLMAANHKFYTDQRSQLQLDLKNEIAELLDKRQHTVQNIEQEELQAAVASLNQSYIDELHESIEHKIKQILNETLNYGQHETTNDFQEFQASTVKTAQDVQKVQTKTAQDVQKVQTKTAQDVQKVQTKTAQDVQKVQTKTAQDVQEVQTSTDHKIVSLKQFRHIRKSQGFTYHEFTLTEFSIHQRGSGEGHWYSEPSYFSSQRYKFKLHILTNGGNFVGVHETYVTVCLHLERKGDYDDQLITVTAHIQLVNQLGDHNHHERTITHNWSKSSKVFKRIGKYIKLSELKNNVKKGTQYLKDDRLYFRVYIKTE